MKHIENERRRLALSLGGTALISSTVLALSLMPLADLLPTATVIWAAIYAAGLVILALGIRGIGSVTNGQPSGTVALVGLAAWLVVRAIVRSLSGMSGNVPESFFTGGITFGTIDALICLILAMVSCVGVLRSEAVPMPWRRAPMWGLAVIVLAWLVQAIYGATVPIYQEPVSAVLASLAGAATSIVSVALGVVAVAIAGWAPADAGAPPKPTT